MILRSDIQMRDPFVVLIGDKYYLYGTTDKDCWSVPATGFDAYVSDDLEHFEGPFPIFRPDADFWADRHSWAPEMHIYRGEYYLFASFKAEGVCRGTQILKADNPLGPFKPWSDGPVTPRDWECLDGTLYVDEDEQPWLVFCHEWQQIKDGTMCAVPLTEDLRMAEGEAVTLFKASDPAWATCYPEPDTNVTDGPFLYRTTKGELIMLWSTYCATGYAITYAESLSESVLGPWKQQDKPLFDRDGGHGMLFTDKNGQLMLSIHTPNDTPNERPFFLPVRDTGDGLERID